MLQNNIVCVPGLHSFIHSFEEDCIEQLCKILYSNGGQFFDDFAGYEVVPW
jgi:hypothetical protein